MIDHPPQQLKEMTSSAAFRCVQAWLLEKPAAWADDPCLAAAQMAQRPPNKRPREDALLEAERSHQRRRIEILDARAALLPDGGEVWRRGGRKRWCTGIFEKSPKTQLPNREVQSRQRRLQRGPRLPPPF